MKYITPSNCLTLSRLCVTPLILPLSITSCILDPLFIFGLAASTDFLDGWCARTFGQETRLGAWLDPLADKVVLASTLFPLVAMHTVHWAVALLFIMREFVVLAVRHKAALLNVSIPVSRFGKLKTVFQFCYLAVCLSPYLATWTILKQTTLVAAIVATVGSMVQYVYRFIQTQYDVKV